MAGYSGTPLARKLGIKAGQRVAIVSDPGTARQLLEPLPDGVEVLDGLVPADVVWFFTRSRAELVANLDALAGAIHPASACWVSWPKKAAARRIPTDLTEDVIREVVLPGGDLVDVKVCAVDDDWSGLKLVWRKERRGSQPLGSGPEPGPAAPAGRRAYIRGVRPLPTTRSTSR